MDRHWQGRGNQFWVFDCGSMDCRRIRDSAKGSLTPEEFSCTNYQGLGTGLPLIGPRYIQ